jgi:hypothetical protein
MMFFDSSTLISMAMTCSLPILRKLKQSYDDDFFITDAVYGETIGRAMQSLRFRYEGYRLKELVEDGVIKVYSDKELQGQIKDLMDSINRTYFTNGRPLSIVQLGEMSATAACLKEHANSIAVDERTTRLLIENPASLKPWLETKLHTDITINEENQEKWLSLISKKFIPVRSAELATTAWEKGILGDNSDVLYGLLWALKFAGCAIAENEIDFYMKRVT